MRKALLAVFATLGLFASTLLAGPASAEGFMSLPVPPPSDHIVIDLVTVNGSGCPAGTAAIAVSPDNTAFTVTYSQFTAQAGAGTKPTDFRKNCQLALNVHVPQGFTFAVAGADYRGYAHLEPGAGGTETANYYFQGESQTTRIHHDFTGPTDSDWERTDSVGIGSLSFLPCGEQRYLNVNTELRVNRGWSSPKTTSFMTMDSTDGSIDTVYHVAWKKC
jgi:Domain of unknown function (DUF4360)